MKPKLKSYPDLERAVELIRTGKVRGRKGIERIIMRCFTKKMLDYKTTRGGIYSAKFENARGCAIQVVRNIYGIHNLR
jgi:hypothetical protein